MLEIEVLSQLRPHLLDIVFIKDLKSKINKIHLTNYKLIIVHAILHWEVSLLLRHVSQISNKCGLGKTEKEPYTTVPQLCKLLDVNSSSI